MSTRLIRLLLALGLALGCGEPTAPLDGGPPPTDSSSPANLAPAGVIDSPSGAVTMNVGQSVFFAATCQDPEGTATTHAWDFGGAADPSSEEDPGSITFDAPGTFTVTYTCTDADGLADPMPSTRVIVVNGGGTARIDAPTTDVVIEPGESVAFAGTCLGEGSDATHAWDFDGGASASNAEDPGEVSFAANGVYVVTYTCTRQGESDSARITVTVSRRPESVIDTPAADVEIEAGESVDFSGHCTDPDGDTSFSHEWDFRGGAPTQRVEDPGPVIFTRGGTFDVLYTCTDELGVPDGTPATVRVSVRPRWLPVVGEFSSDGDELVLIDPGNAGAAPVSVLTWPAFGDVLDGAGAYWAQISPDGRYLAFIADATTDEVEDLYLVDLRSSAPTAINMTNLTQRGWTSTANVSSFRFSPNGEWIAFLARDSDSGFGLSVVDLRAGIGDATRVTDSLSNSLSSAPWSADSTKLYFRALEGALVYEPSTPASGAQPLYRTLATQSLSAVYGMGASLALMVGRLDSDAADLYAVDASGALPATPGRVNATPASIAGTSRLEVEASTIRISPDQTRVLFVADLDERGFLELHFANLSAGVPSTPNSVKIRPDASSPAQRVAQPRWSPVGNRFLYLETASDELYFVDARGSTPAPAVAIDPGEYAADYQWAPDGSGVASRPAWGSPRYVALPGGASPGTPVRLGSFRADSASLRDLYWYSPNVLVFASTFGSVGSAWELVSVDVTTPATMVRLTTTSTGTGFRDPYVTTLPDGNIVAVRRQAERGDAVSLSPTRAGTLGSLHPPLATGRFIRYLVTREP